MKVPTLLRRFNAVVGRIVPAVPARIARNLTLRPRRAGIADDAGGERVSFQDGLSGLRWGRGGPTVLMLHGWEGRAAQFAPLGAALAGAGFQAISLDAPAHGRSPGRETTLMAFAGALRKVAAELGPLDAVVGHSLGAAAAVIALAHGLPAARAVLFAAPASIEAYLHGFAEALALPPAATARFLRSVEAANGVSARALDVRRLAGGLRQPALVVHDRADAQVAFADGDAIAASWRGARLLATDGLGHGRILRDPGVVRAVAGFLAPAAPRALAATG